MASQLSAQETSDLQHVFGLLRPHVPRAMNLADPREHRFVLTQLKHAQLDPDQHQVFKDVEAARQAHLATGAPVERVSQQVDDAPLSWGTVSLLTGLGFAQDGTVNAAALTATPEPLTRNSQILNLYGLDADGNPTPVASSSFPDIEGGGTYDEVFLSGQTTAFPDRRVVFTNVMLPNVDEPATGLKAGQPVVFALVGTPNPGDTDSDPVSPITVTNPVTSLARTYVKVALNRTSDQQPDCDYYYTTGSKGPQPVAGIGGAGTATWSTDIQTPLSDSVDENFYAYLTLVCPSKGGVTLGLSSQTSMVKYFNAKGGQLTWDFEPYNFGQLVPWNSGDTVDYYLRAGVILTGQTDYSEIEVSPDYTRKGENGHYLVLPIVFVWGCVARGSTVTMADGFDRPIELVRSGESVLAGPSGRTLVVLDTTVGREEAGMIRLGLDGDAHLVLTPTHPVATPTGMVMARELSAGDAVHSITGTRAVTSVDDVCEPTDVCNLLLGDPDGQNLDWENATYVANGLVVGDDRAQSEISSLQGGLPERHRAAWTLYHQDFQQRVRLPHGATHRVHSGTPA